MAAGKSEGGQQTVLQVRCLRPGRLRPVLQTQEPDPPLQPFRCGAVQAGDDKFLLLL